MKIISEQLAYKIKFWSNNQFNTLKPLKALSWHEFAIHCIQPLMSFLMLYLVIWNGYTLRLHYNADSIITRSPAASCDKLIFPLFRVMEPIFTQTRSTTRGNGTQINAVAGEECIIKTAQYMKVNGTMIKEMDKACLDYVSVHVLCLILLELGFSLWADIRYNVSIITSVYSCQYNHVSIITSV